MMPDNVQDALLGLLTVVFLAWAGVVYRATLALQVANREIREVLYALKSEIAVLRERLDGRESSRGTE